MQRRLQKLFVFISILAAGPMLAVPAYAAAPAGAPTSGNHKLNGLDRLFRWIEDEALYYLSQICLVAAFVFFVLMFRELIRREWLNAVAMAAGVLFALYIFKGTDNPNAITNGIAQQIPSP